MRGVGDPFRDELPAILVKVDGDHLPIGFVVVDAVEAGTPVVETVEEPVLEHRPAILPGDAAIVDVFRLLFEHLVVVEFRCGGSGGGDPAAQKEREREQTIHQPRQETAARQASYPGVEIVAQPGSQAGLVGQHLGGFGQAEVLDEAQEAHRPESGRMRFDQFFQREFTLLDQEFFAPIGIVFPQAAILHIVFNVGREERLALRKVRRRLEAAQQFQVGSGRGSGRTIRCPVHFHPSLSRKSAALRSY